MSATAKPWRDLSAVPMPARIAALDRDARGYPIPCTVLRDENGLPDFRTIDPNRWVRAAFSRLCGLCGGVLGSHVAFVGGPRSIELRMFTDLGMHRGCAEYALQVCPMLAAPSFAYSRKTDESREVFTDVSTDRPAVFGLGIARGKFEIIKTAAETPVLHPAPFIETTWWRHGQGGVTAG